MPLQNCDIGLLIGYNCPKALIPRDVIAPLDEGPYGQRTDLGWSIIGIVDQSHRNEENDSISISHRIIAREVDFGVNRTGMQEPSCVMFCIRTKTKEVINPDELTRMFELDFVEQSANVKSLSYEDRKFISVLF